METTLQNYDLPELEVLRSIEPNPWNSNEDGIQVFDEPELEDYVEDINDINNIVDINNEEDLILISSANNGKAITVNKVIASTSLPEFPDTLSLGIRYLVST
ncbi:hypothetical protein VF21_09779 [Pseudogymnoascus sp. 05NY08]|nr:hypothetical protein VF21_09779 [Pseudogymnoascus sp. 05NY08]